MIGWENNQGAYFINQLKDNIDSVNSSLITSVEELKADIGKLSDLTTTAKTSLVSAINEVKGLITALTTRNQLSLNVPSGSTYLSASTLKADKVGNVVHLHGTLTLKSVTQPSSITSWTVLTISSGYRPKYALSSIPISTATAISGVNMPVISIATNGNIAIQSNYFNQSRVIGIDTTYILA